MLHHLAIQNYAIIEKASIDFHKNLNILTGETGAGKSIIIGALGLITGKRVDKSVLYNQDDKCIIEANFKLPINHLKAYFEQEDLDFIEDQCIIRREILTSGRSRAFVNDTPAKLEQLQYLGQHLIDIHAQHKIIELKDQVYQTELVDTFAMNLDTLIKYQTQFNEFKIACKELEQLKIQSEQQQKELDYLNFQLQEFDGLDLQADEQDKLEQELNSLNNTELIKSSLGQANQFLSLDEQSITEGLNKMNKVLQDIKSFSPKIEQLSERLNSAAIEIEDIASELEAVNEEFFYDQERISIIEERLNIIYRLQQKHQVQTVEELLATEENLVNQINAINNIDQNIVSLEKQTKNLLAKAKQSAGQLTKQRQKAAKELNQAINKMLPSIGMPFAQLAIQIEAKGEDDLGPLGNDNVQFLLSPDKGNTFLMMDKAASGGELSRIMLCLKKMIATKTNVQSIVFDEIDTGISGDIAGKVGAIIEELGNNYQIICITHLPQIACKGQHHFYISKKMENKKTISSIKLLDKAGRINELAVMLSNNAPTSTAIKNAEELLNN